MDIHSAKINSEYSTDISVKHKTIKLLKDSTGKNPDDLGFDDDILDAILKAQDIKERIDNLDFIKI